MFPTNLRKVCKTTWSAVFICLKPDFWFHQKSGSAVFICFKPDFWFHQKSGSSLFISARSFDSSSRWASCPLRIVISVLCRQRLLVSPKVWLLIQHPPAVPGHHTSIWTQVVGNANNFFFRRRSSYPLNLCPTFTDT